MRKLGGLVLALFCVGAVLFQATAQGPGKKDDDRPGKDKKAKDYSNSSIYKRLMAFDTNKDGKLTKDEVTDKRLHRLFDRADKNKDGVVTKEELLALAAEMDAETGDDDRGGPGGRGKGKGKGGFKGRDDDDGPPGGPGGPGGRGPGGPPQPGQILPQFVQERLELTADQKKQLAVLQKEVDDKLAKILTTEQKKQLKEMRERGPGGPGGRGPGGPPPDGGPGRGRGGPPPERDFDGSEE